MKPHEEIQKMAMDLLSRFSESVLSDEKKIAKLKRLNPRFIDEYHEKWKEFDTLSEKYIKGELDLDSDVHVQMEINEIGQPCAEIKNPITMKRFVNDFFCWFMSKTRDL